MTARAASKGAWVPAAAACRYILRDARKLFLIHYGRQIGRQVPVAPFTGRRKMFRKIDPIQEVWLALNQQRSDLGAPRRHRLLEQSINLTQWP